MTNDEATIAAIDALATSQVPSMLVGAFAANFHGVARSTNDADFVVELGDRGIEEIVRHLSAAFRLDPQTYFETITMTTRYVVQVVGQPFLIEFFELSEDAHDRERFRRRLNVNLFGRTVSVLTAEDLIITKLRWFSIGRRPKDQADARAVAAVQRDHLDWRYIESWCGQHGTSADFAHLRGSLPST